MSICPSDRYALTNHDLYRHRYYPHGGLYGYCLVTVPAILPPILLVASGFSPNGDGINDFLLPVGRDIAEIVRFEVFNRLGKMI